FSALYAEALARWRDIPSLLFVIPAVVPLIPGAPLYYAMSFAVASDWTQVASYALRTGQFALGIAVGMCVTWLFASLLKPKSR
ncbi:MAG: threonine/serine exporter family protein, partial [Coriobacteriia bacterium]|nr:threonine/serine exporter family protein [Coriobacteriia bacterium]